MPVAQRDIREIYDILWKYVTIEELQELLEELTTTNAYKTNQSFRTTINRLKGE